MGRRLAVLAALGCACGNGSGDVDAGDRDALVRADATPIDCPSEVATSISLGSDFEAGGSADLNFAGPGAFAAQGGSNGPPGEILYVEAYRAMFTGDSVVQNQFLAWRAECQVCVFIGLDCPSYSIPFEGVDPRAPSDCASLYMLDAGQIDFSTLDTDPATGTLSGSVSATSGSTIRFVEVGRTGEPGEPGGFGERIPDGDCIVTDAPIDFSGSWGGVTPPPDAGIADAAPATD